MLKIIERIYISTFYKANCLAEDNTEGITSVLSLNEEQFYNNLPSSISRKWKPFPDEEYITSEFIEECVQFLMEEYKKGETLLIHCFAGMSRSPMITAAFLIRLGITTEHSYVHFLEKVHDYVNIHPKLKKSLTKWNSIYNGK